MACRTMNRCAGVALQQPAMHLHVADSGQAMEHRQGNSRSVTWTAVQSKAAGSLIVCDLAHAGGLPRRWPNANQPW
ncbi:hypothetical protein XVE_2166 [Xanthomonas vesicatoria ATCC 35937]|uniref:Uncharacterized protein n=2 Tax=Xanthomonas vesicatoria TaxID=56460 RepID=F0BDF0_9XANT|nr:hypothetical protein XVE_2166 [Xanthomonas vesicatoria ATCC 35937]